MNEIHQEVANLKNLLHVVTSQLLHNGNLSPNRIFEGLDKDEDAHLWGAIDDRDKQNHLP